jgi:dTDP-4-amino-4,6-dideoxygalactose transaminase
LLGEVEGIVTPLEADYSRHVYHIYAVRVREREAVMRFLEEKEIGCAIHYPVPVHLQEAYRNLGYSDGSFPVAELTAREFVSLPMFPELTAIQVELVSEAVKEVVATQKVA